MQWFYELALLHVLGLIASFPAQQPPAMNFTPVHCDRLASLQGLACRPATSPIVIVINYVPTLQIAGTLFNRVSFQAGPTIQSPVKSVAPVW